MSVLSCSATFVLQAPSEAGFFSHACISGNHALATSEHVKTGVTQSKGASKEEKKKKRKADESAPAPRDDAPEDVESKKKRKKQKLDAADADGKTEKVD